MTDDKAETWTITIRGARAAAFRAIADKRNRDSPDAFGPIGHMPNLTVDIFEAGLVAFAEREAPDAAVTLKHEIEREQRIREQEAKRMAQAARERGRML